MKRFTFLITLVFFASSAYAIPRAPFDGLKEEVMALQGSPLTDFDFNGIVSLSNCSASLVRFSGQPDSSQAYVLTNGHCISPWGGFLKPGEVVYREESTRGMNVFVSLNKRVRVSSNMLVYATMTDTDAALYRLDSTYSDLKQQGIEAFELSFEHPLVGQEMKIVSGYWKRGFECQVDGFVYQLKEADWTFLDSIRYSESGCEVYGGTSGSPVLDAHDRVVIGVNNTGNESGGECRMNNPCEVDKDGNKTVIPGRGYGQQTYWFYSCLTEDFQIDLDREGCELPR